MISSLVFQHSLRQSSACIESLKYSPDSATFLSVDHLALRTWSPTKQLRAFHIEKDFKFLLLEYLEMFSVYMFVYYKPSAHRGFVELWSSDLNSLEKVELVQNCHANMFCTLSPSKSTLIMTDNDFNIFIYDIMIRKTAKPSQIAWFPKGITLDQSTGVKEKYKFSLVFGHQQIIIASDQQVKMPSIQGILSVDDTVFLTASERSLFLFGRGTTGCNTRGDAPSHPLFEMDPSFKLLAFHESLFTNLGACVLSLHVFQSPDFSSYLFAAYDNGTVGIFSLGNINMYLENGELNSFSQAPSLLLVFQAHSPDLRLPFCPLRLQLSPLSVIPGTSKYLREFYTFGSDFKILHWGLRTCHKEGMCNSVEVDILGSIQFPLDSVEHSRFAKQKRKSPNHLINSSLCLFSVQEFSPHKFTRHCSTHGLAITIGGMLAFVMIQQPSKLLFPFQPPQHTILSTSCGEVSLPVSQYFPQLLKRTDGNLAGYLSVTAETEVQPRSEEVFFLLSDGMVVAHSVRTGKLIFQLPVVHPPVENPAPQSQSLLSLKGALVSLNYHEPCCIHYPELSHHLIVGYSDGAVCVFAFQIPPFGSDDLHPQSLIPTSIVLLDTKSCHTSPITFLTTIPMRDRSSHPHSSWLLVGDNLGTLSIWRVPRRMSEKIKLCQSTRGHLGSIVAVDIFPLSHSVSKIESKGAAGDYIFFSASSAGEIKAWSWREGSGELSHVGGIRNTGLRISTLGVVVLGSPTDAKTSFVEECNLLCLSGHSNGMIMSWAFSSNPNRIRNDSITALQAHTGPVVSLSLLDGHHFPQTEHIDKYLLSASLDGSCSLLGVTSEGKILSLHRYFSPGPTHAIFLATHDRDIEVFQVNEHTVTSFIVTTSESIIPSRWRETSLTHSYELDFDDTPRSDPSQPAERSSRSVILGSAETPITMRKTSSSSQPLTLTLNLDTSLNPYDDPQTSALSPLSPRSLSTDVSIGQMNSLKIGHLSLKNLKHLTNREIWKADNHDFLSVHDELHDEEVLSPSFLESEGRSDLDKLASWNITLGVRTELQNAKKDKLLLDYFRQNCLESKFPAEVVTARDAAEILDRWVAGIIKDNSVGDTITKKQVLDIFSVLNVSEEDLLDFIKVAKLGAVLVTIHRNMIKVGPFLDQGLFGSKNRLKKKFSHMRTSNTLVTYNSMGEKVIQKRAFEEKTITGIPNGYSSLLRKIWNQSSTRVPYHVNGVSIVASNQAGIVKDIPQHIKQLLNKGVKLPRKWSSKLEHYFDLKRAVRISRTLFDMRQNYQQDFVLCEENPHKTATAGVPSMSEIMVKYFERNFGGGDMLVAHHKVAHFLEALCQYSDFSLLNTIRYFIFSEEAPNSFIQKYIWLYVEARRWVFLHCDVITGGSVSGLHSATKEGSLQEQSLTTCGSASTLYLNWLLIQKSDSLLCLQEFLGKRGSYGPSVIENVRSVIVHALPPSSQIDEDNEFLSQTREYIDLEQFLEALIFETKKQDQLISEIREQIFGSPALPQNVLLSGQSMTDDDSPGASVGSRGEQKRLVSREVIYSSLLTTLGKTQEMLQIFMTADPKRCGFTSSDSFRNVLMCCLESSPPLAQESFEHNYFENSLKVKLTQECMSRYSSGEGSDSIGYIDFVALSLSWLYQQSEEVSSLHSAWMITAVRSLRRGIDREQGKALLLFLASAQAFPSSSDHLWMARDGHTEAFETDASHLLSSSSLMTFKTFDPSRSTDSNLFTLQKLKRISSEGKWNPYTAVASDDPGLLTITKITSLPPSTGEVALGVDGVEWRTLSKKSIDSSLFSKIVVPSTNRELRTVHGEVCHESHMSRNKFTPALISAHDLTFGIEVIPPANSKFRHKSHLVGGVRLEGGIESAKVAEPREVSISSRAKSVSLRIPLNRSKVDEDPFPTPTAAVSDADTNVAERREGDQQLTQLLSAVEGDVLPIVHLPETIPSSVSLGTGYVSSTSRLLCKSANFYSQSEEEQSLEKSLLEFESMRKLEEEMMKEIDDVNLQSTLKLHEKYLAEKESRRLLRLKERESMKFKEDADEQRMKRKQQGLELEEKARALEEADRLAKEEEARNKQAEIRAARAAQEAIKRQKELLEAEVHREMLELQAMRKEERLSVAVEKAIAERMAREERLKREQLEREEAEREAERLRLLAAEERRIKAEQEAIRQAEIAAKKKEREDELQEQAYMSREDFDVAPEVLLVEAPPEEIPEEEPVEPEPPVVELTGARLKLYNIIKRLIATQAGQKNHPRKNDNHHYFMPFAFGHDIRFDPFAPGPHWDGPPNLEDEDEDSMPQTGYDDITKALRDKKNSLERRKKNQLYHLNNPDIPSKDWTPMFRVDTVDWQEYFEEEFRQLKQKLHITPPLASDANQLGSPEAAEGEEQEKDTDPLSVKRFENNVTYITGSLGSQPTPLREQEDPKKLIPLPLGRVVKSLVSRGQEIFFQVEMSDASSILTLELTCSNGGSDLEVNLASGYFPSPIKCDARASKSASGDVHTIVFQPCSELSIASNSPITLVVAIHLRPHSTTMRLPFSVWAMDSASPHHSAEIDRVTNAIAAFNLLSSHPKDELWKNLPKLHRLAHGESMKSKRSSISDGDTLCHSASETGGRFLTPSLFSDAGGSGSCQSAPLSDDGRGDSFEFTSAGAAPLEEDLRDLERFISKSGRMKMRSEIEKHRKGKQTPEKRSRLDKVMDPNRHSDLFVMETPQDFRVTTSIADTEIDTGAEKGVGHLKSSPAASSKSSKLFDMAFEAFDPEKYFQKSDDHLPRLATPMKADRIPAKEDPLTLPRTELPFVTMPLPNRKTMAAAERASVSQKLRKFPTPKPVKYTISK